MDRAIRRLGVFLMALFVVLFVQLNYIQVFRAEQLNERVGNSRPVDQAFSRPRGTVSTADGVLLARSVPSGDRYEYQREFPQGELYAHVTGYFNYNFGATALEHRFNTELAGRTARQQIRSLGDLFVERDRTGNLELTLRSDVQTAARDALGAQKGSVVALDPRTGAVLALWSWPSFDPNVLSSHDFEATIDARAMLEAADGKPLLAKSYRELYPPGSTFKVVTGATGLETGQVTPDDPVYPSVASIVPPQTTRPLPNFGGSTCGGTFFTVMARSCNTSFAQMGLDLGGEALIEGAEGFGFNDTVPFDLAAVQSHFPDPGFDQNQPALAQSAIGQSSVTATPLQMALVAAGIANDGVIMEPYLVAEIRDGEGELVSSHEPTAWRRSVGSATAATMREAMRGVVTGGSATRLQIEGADVGAKTGTAQFGVATEDSPRRSHAWVIAWAGPPGQAPTVAVAVLVEDQSGASEGTGGRVAAPIAKQVIEAALRPVPPPPAAVPGDPETDDPAVGEPGTGDGGAPGPGDGGTGPGDDEPEGD